MDKYLYILVGIIWVVNNLYKSFKKKEAKSEVPQSDGNTSEKGGRNIETILEELLSAEPKQEKPLINEKKEVQKTERQKVRQSSYSNEKGAAARAKEVEFNNAFSYETPSSNIKKGALQTAPAEIENEEIAFDLRSAIIYSEIMAKPKYLEDI